MKQPSVVWAVESMLALRAERKTAKAIWSDEERGVLLVRQSRKGTHEGNQTFAVIYGKQVDKDLSYADACAKLGQAIMHSLACDGEMD